MEVVSRSARHLWAATQGVIRAPDGDAVSVDEFAIGHCGESSGRLALGVGRLVAAAELRYAMDVALSRSWKCSRDTETG
jgi:hypothetical protein